MDTFKVISRLLIICVKKSQTTFRYSKYRGRYTRYLYFDETIPRKRTLWLSPEECSSQAIKLAPKHRNAHHPFTFVVPEACAGVRENS